MNMNFKHISDFNVFKQIIRIILNVCINLHKISFLAKHLTKPLTEIVDEKCQ